jgi:DNA polymerase elongation subunit (family B)
MKKSYYAKSKVKNESILFCAFDTETDGLGGKILCCTYSNPIKTDIYLGENCAVQWLENVFFNLPFPAIHYAHFAQYDWRYLIPHLLEHKDEYEKLEFNLRTDKDIYQIKVKRKNKWYIMRDSYALYPDTLRNFAKQFSPSLLKLDLDFEIEKFDPTNLEHINYAKRDAQVLRECLMNFNVAIEKLFGVSVGHTTAGTAIKAWQNSLVNDEIIDYSIDNDSEQFIRSAYYGGLVFLTSNAKHQNCKTFDINSSYPYVMQTYPMPIGSPIRTLEFNFELPSIYDVDVKTPINLKIPILPCRNSRGSMQWRSGEFRTQVTGYELKFALEHGYQITEYHSGLIWHSVINPFFDFIENCKTIRKNHPKTSYERIAKLMQNSAYGKFGAKRERNAIIFGQENIKPDSEATLLSGDYDDVFVSSEYADDMPCKPEWAVFITAYARLRLLAVAYAIGTDHVLYGDTDSLTVDSQANLDAIPRGSEYGQFKLEKAWKTFRAIAPKTYAGQLENGQWAGAGKGLSTSKMSQQKYRELYENGECDVVYESLPSLVVALRQPMGPATSKTRKSSNLQNSVNYSFQNERVILKCRHG